MLGHYDHLQRCLRSESSAQQLDRQELSVVWPALLLQHWQPLFSAMKRSDVELQSVALLTVTEWVICYCGIIVHHVHVETFPDWGKKKTFL